MKKIVLSILSILLITTNICASSVKNDLATLKENYKKTILFEGEDNLIKLLITLPYEEYFSDQMVVELLDRYPIQEELIDKYVSTIEDNGSWVDIDYHSQERSGWRPKIHVERILLLTRAYANKNHKAYKSKKVETTIHQALSFWFDAKLVCPNWWYNQIGVPKTLGAAVLLFEDRLTEQEKVGAIEVLGKSKFGMTGQNKVWLAGNVLIKAMLEEDMETIAKAQEQIFSEIKIGEGNNEGIKTDWAFHQHGTQQQFGNYGAAFLATTSFWAKVFAGTNYAIDQERLDLMYSLITQGYQRVLWKGYLDINGLGRQFFKQAQRHKALSVLFSSRMLAEVDAKNKHSYQKLIDENTFGLEGERSFTGLYHFWLSDQTVQRSRGWMASVKMSSNRVIGTESGNGDNKKGYYLADGATYTYVDGDEYYNTAAVWDWRKIPGTTTYQTDLPLKEFSWGGNKNRSDFVGNVNDGRYGLTAMDLNHDGLTGRKSWFFTPDYVLCLGAAITSDSVCKVATTIEQNLKKGELFVLKEADGLQKYYHYKTGYIVWREGVTTQTRTQSGSWHDIMSTYPNQSSEVDTKEIVTIFQEHGMSPKSESYQYLLLPNKSKDEVERFDVKDIKVLANDKDLQVVDLVEEEKLLVAAYTPQNMRLKEDVNIRLSEACLLLIDYSDLRTIYVSDPTHQLDELTIGWNEKEKKVSLPSGEFRGSSVVVRF